VLSKDVEMSRVVSSSSFISSSASTSVEQRPASVRNETWHTDRVLKPHMQRHTNITPVSFAAPSGGVRFNGQVNSAIFNLYIAISPERCEIAP